MARLQDKRFLPPQRAIGTALVALVLAVLTACSGPAQLSTGAQDAEEYAYAMSVELRPHDTVATVEERYGGSVVLWQPEAGFAILGLDEASTSGLSTQARKSLEPNRRGVFAPTRAEGGGTVEGDGWSAWAGGWSAWAGGWSAWAGGWSAWAGGASGEPTTFEQNLDEWHNINLPAAQEMAPAFGAGVKVAVIDSGIDLEHPAFAGHLAPASEWRDYVGGDATPQEEWDSEPGASNAGYGHGTGVAGVVLQIAPEATILPLRVLGPDGSGSVLSVALAIHSAVEKGAQVINLSLGSHHESLTLQTMVWYATQNGVYVVSSAGNTFTEQLTYPAAYASGPSRQNELAVSVGSVDVNDRKSPFSAYGRELEVLAPGEFIYTPVPDDRVGYWSGTSVAAPMVSGGLALALAEQVAPGTVVSQELVQTADNVDDMNPGGLNGKLGHGRIDLAAFLQRALGGR